MSLTYPIKLEPDDNGTLLVTCPALPEVTTFGEDEAEAIKHARDAIEEAIAARMADGREVPGPKGRSRVLVILPMQTSLKVELYRLLTQRMSPELNLCGAPELEARVKLIGCFEPSVWGKTRMGTCCRSPAVSSKKRCRMHGGAKGSGAPAVAMR